MSLNLNHVCLVGNLTRDPELKYTTSGTPLANFGVAVNRITKNEEGDYDVDFFNVTAWQKTAEFIHKYGRKGKKVSIEGRLQQRSWIDQTTQEKRTVVEVVADRVSVEFSQDREEESSAEERVGQRAAQTAQSSRRREPNPPAPGEDDLDETDPFADE